MLSFKLTSGLLALLLLSDSDAFTPVGLAAQRSQVHPSSQLMVRHVDNFHLEEHGIFCYTYVNLLASRPVLGLGMSCLYLFLSS